MAFHTRLREYRISILNLKQKEVAHRLGMQPNTYSHYENGHRDIPISELKNIKESLSISDEDFLQMLLERPRIKLPKEIQQLQQTMKDRQQEYYSTFHHSYDELIQSSYELRDLISLLQTMNPKKQRHFLNAIRSFIDAQKGLLDEIEQKEQQLQQCQSKLNQFHYD